MLTNTLRLQFEPIKLPLKDIPNVEHGKGMLRKLCEVQLPFVEPRIGDLKSGGFDPTALTEVKFTPCRKLVICQYGKFVGFTKNVVLRDVIFFKISGLFGYPSSVEEMGAEQLATIGDNDHYPYCMVNRLADRYWVERDSNKRLTHADWLDINLDPLFAKDPIIAHFRPEN